MTEEEAIADDAMLPGVTLDQHLALRQRDIPGATGDFTGLFQQLSVAAKLIASRVRKAGLTSLLGLTGNTNVQGEAVQKLDVYANRAMLSCIGNGRFVAVAASEELEELVVMPPRSGNRHGRYALVFDPLDGSGNIDVNAATGTIFAIYRRSHPELAPTEGDVLRPGRELAAAGYVVYGSSTVFVYSTGDGVHEFTYDPAIGEFLLSRADMRIPERGAVYSVNEANAHRWHPNTRRWVKRVKTMPHVAGGEDRVTLRYSGAMVADVHRIFCQGGVFMYPAEPDKPVGKLRLLYEAAPFAFLAQAAGGMASDGKQAIVDIKPNGLHQRTPLFLGSKSMIEDYLKHDAAPHLLPDESGFDM